MKFTITNTITYDVDDQLLNDFLQKENITMEDYKREIINNFKEMFESEIDPREMKNLSIETNVNALSYQCVCGAKYINLPDKCDFCGGINCFYKIK